MKKIIDRGTLSPAEKARIRYYQLFEEQMIFKANRKEKRDYITELKQIIRLAI